MAFNRISAEIACKIMHILSTTLCLYLATFLIAMCAPGFKTLLMLLLSAIYLIVYVTNYKGGSAGAVIGLAMIAYFAAGLFMGVLTRGATLVWARPSIRPYTFVLIVVAGFSVLPILVWLRLSGDALTLIVTAVILATPYFLWLKPDKSDRRPPRSLE